MADFFKESDLVIIIDDDYCPQNKGLAFTCLNTDIIGKVANDLDMVDSEYNDKSIGEIETVLKYKGNDLNSYFKINEPEEFSHAKVERYHPYDISSSTICDRIGENKAGRNFVVLDQFLDGEESLEPLNNYLTALYKKLVSDCYIGIVFWSSRPSDIKTLKDANDYLTNKVGLPREVAEGLSMYVNFIDKNTADCSNSFEEAFRKSQNNNLITLFSKSFKDSVNNLKSKMWDINNNAELIHYDYLMEGMQLDDIFFEIFQASFKKMYNSYCKNDYERYINPIRKAVQKYENEIYTDDGINQRVFVSRSVKELNNLMKNENLIQDCKKSDDIKFGDIFKISDEYYMVVTQGCDLSIRMLGARKKDYIDLIKIEVRNEKPKNKEILDKLSTNYRNSFNQNGFKKFIPDNLNIFANIGIDETVMQQILNNPDGEDLNMTINEVKLDKKNIKIYSVESIFLDCIILPVGSEGVEITEDSIEKAKEIRTATKKYVKEKFQEFITKFSDLNKEVLTKLADPNKKCISTLVPFQFKFNEEDELMGLIVESSQISRVGRLDYIRAHEIFKEFMNKYSRYEYNNPPLID